MKHHRSVTHVMHRLICLLLVMCLCVPAASACTQVPEENLMGKAAVKPATAEVLIAVIEAEKTPPKPEPVSLNIIMHAGGGANGRTYYNAQQLFYYYYNLGYRIFEYDCHLSSDGRIICTHGWENFDFQGSESIRYKSFKTFKLADGYTPAYEEWLMETLIRYPDVTFIIDAKAKDDEGDARVLARFEELEDIYGIDLSDRIIPEVFTRRMWELVKDTTDFNRYIFSLYKEEYTGEELLTYFSDERIFAFSLHVYCPGNVRSFIDQMKAAGKTILIFTPTTPDELDLAIRMQADGICVDTVDLLAQANIVSSPDVFGNAQKNDSNTEADTLP